MVSIPEITAPSAYSYLLELINNTFYNHKRRVSQRWDYEDFDMDSDSAFFPRQPLSPLSSTYAIWEAALREAPENLRLGSDVSDEALSLRFRGAQWRENIRQWPVLPIAELTEDAQLQRAHTVLAFLAHWFVHSSPPTPDGESVHIPGPLAIPLVEVSRMLRIAPVLTFADTILWNWERPSNADIKAGPIIGRMQYTNVFSRTQDEENFYIVSAQAELLGIEAVHAIQAYSSLENVNIDDSAALKIAADLDRIKDSINEIASSLRSIRAMVDPRVFYDEIRPWFVGSTAERPWVFEGVDQSDLVELDGPSSGQSSIMHALDVFLSIDHGSSPKGFMKRMRSYMPGTQQDWLEHLSQSPTPVHRLAEQHPTIREPYNQAVRALVKLRDQHIRVAALYVVSMSKSRPTCPLMRGMKIAEARGQDSPARGTGGNPVSVLLKASRDATRQAVIAA